MTERDQDIDDLFSGAGRAGLLTAAGLAAGVGLPLVLLAAALGGVIRSDLPSSGGSDAALGALPPGAAEIPADQLVVMQRVSRESGIPWQIFAAIARVESNFGRNMATSSAGAVGYGQFLPATWAAFGRGGDPYDYRDVIPVMARYLLAHGAPGDLRRALYAYNHSWAHVDDVLARSTAYGLGAPAAPALAGADPDIDRRRAAVLAITLAQRGKPYVFGAAGPDAFDCSGLVQWVFRQAGIGTPRTAQQQYDWATSIPPAGMEIADLIFFRRTYPSADDITHVGIYAGGGQIVVAPQAGAPVRLEAVDTPYWRAHFAGVGRVRGLGSAPGSGLAFAGKAGGR